VRNRTNRASPSALSILVTGSALLVVLVLIPESAKTERVREAVPILPGSVTFVAAGILVASFIIASVVFVGDSLAAKSVDFDAIERRRQIRRIVVAWVAAFLMVYLLTALVLSVVYPKEVEENSQLIAPEAESAEEEEELSLPLVEDSPTGGSDATSVGSERRNRTIAILAIIAATAASVVVGVLGLLRVRRAPLQIEEAMGKLREELVRSTRIGLQRLLSTGDDRESVIAAYAIVEEVFAEHGYARTQSVTPRAHVTKTVLGLGLLSSESGRSAILELASLFELARFSDQKMGATERQAAVHCMKRIEMDLEAEVRG